MKIYRVNSHRDTCVWKGLLAGLAGGLAGTYVMSQFQSLWSKLSEGDEQQSEEKKKSQNSVKKDEPATVKAASVISENVLDHKLTESEKEPAGEAMHYAMGGTSGAVYGLASEFAPSVTVGSGLPFGTAVWFVADEVAVPALGLSKSPTETPLSKHVYGLASHFVYGLTTDLVRRAVRRAL